MWWTRKSARESLLHCIPELRTLSIHIIGLRPFAITWASNDVKLIVAIISNVDTLAESIAPFRSTVACRKTKHWEEE